MAAKSRTAPSTPRLSEYAKHFVYPAGIERTVWTRVEAKGEDLGLRFDWWQSQLGTVCLGYGADGKYVATVGGIGLSIPRQVGKTFFVLATLVILCILFPGLQVVWTAHHLRTSTRTFTALRGICKRRKVAPHVKAMRAANGEQQVEFMNGSVIMFGARAMGFGRGFDVIDVEVFDEAQILDTKALEDMVAATNQARHKHGALLFFMGTPPRPTDPSDAFTHRRERAITGKAKNAVWLEISADPKSHPDDRSQWPLMNPSFPSRTPVESMERLRENLSDDDSWNHEGRGIWDEMGSGGALDYLRWLQVSDPTAERGSDVVFGVDVTQDREAWVAVAWHRPDGGVQVMLANDGRSLPAFRVGEYVRELAGKWQGQVTGSKSLEDDMPHGFVPLTSADFTVASGGFADLLEAGTVRHGNQPALNAAVKAAKWRSAGTGGERAFLLRDCPEVGPLAAAARALHVLSAGVRPFVLS